MSVPRIIWEKEKGKDPKNRLLVPASNQISKRLEKGGPPQSETQIPSMVEGQKKKKTTGAPVLQQRSYETLGKSPIDSKGQKPKEEDTE